MPQDVKPRFDPTINLGHMLTFLGFVLTGYAAFTAVKSELSTVAIRVSGIEKQIDRLAEVMVLTAQTQVEITELRRRLDRVESRKAQ